jgi:tetratricopeptide (TPR) repeat protein
VLVALVSLVAGLGAALWQAGVAARQRDAARARSRETEQVAAFQASQLRNLDPYLMGSRLREDLLSGAAAAMSREGLDQKAIEERRSQLAALLADVNLTDVSLSALNRNVFSGTVTAIREKFADQPSVQASLLLSAAGTMADLGLLDDAEAPMQEALAIRRQLAGDDDAATIEASVDLGGLTMRRGRLGEAERQLHEALDRSRRVLGEDHPLTIDTLINLGMLCFTQNRFLEAESREREALERSERTLGPDDPRTLRCALDLGVVTMPKRDHRESEALLRRAYEGFSKLRGPDHRDTVKALDNLASCLRLEKKFDEADPLMRESLRTLRERNGEFHPDTLSCLAALGLMLEDRGSPDDLVEAETCFREALDGRRRTLGVSHSDTLQLQYYLGENLRLRGRNQEAEGVLRQALAGQERLGASTSPIAFMIRLDLARALTGLARYPESESLLLSTSKALGAGHGGAGAGRGPNGEDPCARDLVDLYTAWDRAEPGKGYDAKAAEWRQRAGPAEEPTTQPAGGAAP